MSGTGDVVDGAGEEVDSEVWGGAGGDVAEVDKVRLSGGVPDRGEDDEDGGVGGGHDTCVVAFEGDVRVRGEVVGGGEEEREWREREEEVEGLGDEGGEEGEERGGHCIGKVDKYEFTVKDRVYS